MGGGGGECVGMSVVVVGWGWVCVGRLGVGFACVRVLGVRALGVRVCLRACVCWVCVYACVRACVGCACVCALLCGCGCVWIDGCAFTFVQLWVWQAAMRPKWVYACVCQVGREARSG